MIKKIAIGFVCLMFAGAAVGQGQGRPPSDVNVINEPTVMVGNTVTVENEALVPLTVQEAYPRAPFQVVINVNLPPGTRDNLPEGTPVFSVPVGQRAIIETITIVAFIPEDQYPGIGIRTTAGGATVAHFFGPPQIPIPLSLAEPSQHYRFSESVRIYADSGTNIVGLFLRDGLDQSKPGTGGFSISLSGYLVSENSSSLSP